MEENRSAASKGGLLNFLRLEDVINLREMEEEGAVATSRFSGHWLESQRRRLNDIVGADKSNREIIQSTPSEKTGLKNNLKIGDDGCIPEGKWKCPSCSIGCSSAERDYRDSVKSRTVPAVAAEGLFSFSKKATDAPSPGKLSTEDERDRQRKHNRSHNTSKRQKYSTAGLARKEKYARLRIRQRARLLRSKRSLMGPSAQGTSHTELLQGIIIAGSLYKNQQQTWSEYELDCLLVGVDRHGLRNWEAILRDPGLRFSRSKTTKDLMDRWYLEELNSTFPSFKGR